MDRTVLERIADALELTGRETVIEIGPGRGALTALLRPRARRLIAVEIDRALAADLRERYANDPAVTIVEADVLKTDLQGLAAGPYVLAGNVPYYITTPIIFRSLEPPAPTRSVFLVQREVAERIVAEPGTAAYGALSVNVQALARPEILFGVPPRAFKPAPRVDSAAVRLTPLADPLVAREHTSGFQSFVMALFGLRRKQLQRALRSVGTMSPQRVDGILASGGWAREARAETLPPADFARLFELSRD